MIRADVMILGAGFAGLGAALALNAKGGRVVIVDRRGAAEETSFGNAGLIQAEAAVPYAFPRRLPTLLGALLDRRADARLHLTRLPHTARFLIAYAAHSGASAVDRTARANIPLLAHAIRDHRALADAAGALALWRDGGYLRLQRSARAMAAAVAESESARARYGVPYAVWDAARLAAEEPHLAQTLAGAIHHPTPARISDPGALGKAYAALFEARGGRLATGDAQTLSQQVGGFTVQTTDGAVAARECVIALGPWSGALLARFGVRIPLGIKRGYHMHYAPADGARLHNLVVDEANGTVLGPNARGIRLTTGAEFAPLDAPHTPVQVDRAERAARSLFPLGPRLDPQAWRGARPCLPDLLPMVGPVPAVAGLWAHFGHQHLGLTLGPTTGRLLAQIMTADVPFTDPSPYRVDRFS